MRRRHVRTRQRLRRLQRQNADLGARGAVQTFRRRVSATVCFGRSSAERGSASSWLYAHGRGCCRVRGQRRGCMRADVVALRKVDATAVCTWIKFCRAKVDAAAVYARGGWLYAERDPGRWPGCAESKGGPLTQIEQRGCGGAARVLGSIKKTSASRNARRCVDRVRHFTTITR